MPVSVKITPWSQSFQVLVNETLSPKARNDLMAQEIRLIVADSDETNRATLGVIPPKKVTINGREDPSLSGRALSWGDFKVIPPDAGVVVAEYQLAQDVLKWIMETLRARSPVISGAYRDAHVMFADDTEADANNPPMAQEYTFTNSVPYARKIEIGKTESGRDFTIQVPNRIYERTAQDARARFGNLAKISFTFRPVMGGGIGAWAKSPSALRHAARHRRRSKSTEWLTNQPAIVVALR